MAARLMHERRKAPRVLDQFSLAITESGKAFQADTQNLSASGAYCALTQFLPPMTKLRLDFALPDGAHQARIRCTGVVVRVEPIVTHERARYNTAIFFTDLAERDRSLISRYVSQRLSERAS